MDMDMGTGTDGSGKHGGSESETEIETEIETRNPSEKDAVSEMPAVSLSGFPEADDSLSARENDVPSGDGGISEPSSRMVFHYNREHRLARASEAVRRTYTEGYTPNKGFIKGLTANAGLRSMLAVIVILCAAIALISVFGPSENEGRFAGVPVRLTALSFGETLLVAVSFDALAPSPASGPPAPVSSSEKRASASPASGTASAVMAEGPSVFPAAVGAEIVAFDRDKNPVSTAETFGIYAGEELVLRYSGVDYDADSVAVTVSFLDEADRVAAGEGGTPLTLSAKVRRE